VVFCRLSSLQRSLYQAFLKSGPVQALLANTAPKSAGAAGQARSGRRRSGRAPTGAAAGALGAPREGGPPGQAAQEGAAGLQAAGAQRPRGPQLAPLVAISALKKLCCHPDLIYDLCGSTVDTMSPHAAMACMGPPPAAVRQVGGRSMSIPLAGRALQCMGDDVCVRRRARSGRAAGLRYSNKGHDQGNTQHTQVAGFEGCRQLFHQQMTPMYQRGTSQAYHSGKVSCEQLIRALQQMQKMLFQLLMALARLPGPAL
jgi:hypothetical protein